MPCANLPEAVREFVEFDESAVTQHNSKVFPAQLPESRNFKGRVQIVTFYLAARKQDPSNPKRVF